jgi:type IV pilus assembly protein PilB
MVGEIRDSETAAMAVHSALTGHLLLSTLHTNNARATIDRLMNMGIPQYLIDSVLSCVVAQRLVRKLCERCKKPAAHIKGRGYSAVGCEECRMTGFKGRMVIYELLSNPKEIKGCRTSRGRNFVSMREEGERKALSGLTTFEEVDRVMQE